MNLNSNTIIVIIATLVVGALAYWYFFTGTSNEAPLSAAPQEIVSSKARSQFEALVRELQPISLNTAIFSDPRFSALTSLGTPVAPEPAGRIDPFAPLSSAAAPQTHSARKPARR